MGSRDTIGQGLWFFILLTASVILPPKDPPDLNILSYILLQNLLYLCFGIVVGLFKERGEFALCCLPSLYCHSQGFLFQ